MSTRDDILARIRAANRAGQANGADGTASAAAPSVIPRDYQTSRDVPEGILARFCERVADYRAQVEVVPDAQVATAVAAALNAVGAKQIAVAEGVPSRWRPLEPGAFVTVDDDPEHPLDVAELQALDAVVTGAAVGIAETGTVVLDGGPACGRRALTLVPDAHVCLVAASDLVDDVPAAVARLRPVRPLTWISGPSATSDIELQRVEGVHGPRRLHVIVVQA